VTFRRKTALKAFVCWLVAFILIADWPVALSLASRHLSQSLLLSRDVVTVMCGGGSGAPVHGTPVRMAPCPICQAVLTGHAVLPDSVPPLCPVFERGPSNVPESSIIAGIARIRPHLPRGPPPA
jgi:hypothetical protein